MYLTRLRFKRRLRRSWLLKLCTRDDREVNRCYRHLARLEKESKRNALTTEIELRKLLQQMLDVAENADETGYVPDVGFVDLDKLHAKVRTALGQ